MSDTEKQKRYFTPRQLAERWEVSIRKAQQIAKSGEIASMRVGRTVRIPASAVAAYEKSHTRRPGESRWSS
ncbi:helix-turn-helix domain-containing protein [Rhodococcus sp. T2V]|uniref:helix-turn-helix domain-containing protein n=1 Tax=Rhodococcus sp. T2V TaxID=3034164 RepID=UPI0023E1B356|nr:helix-turn-helix domain-containing protein [Rhodococcus sp. T2V]MDF3308761.1 helix-turn-helix domain-containing protein [Rhodococcus sp. T2V]